MRTVQSTWRTMWAIADKRANPRADLRARQLPQGVRVQAVSPLQVAPAGAILVMRAAAGAGMLAGDALNAIHFHPPGGLLLPGRPRTMTMDLSDRLVEHDHWLTARLLENAATLSDDALDPINGYAG